MTNQSKAEAALLGATLIWGSTFAAMKIALIDVSPVLLTAIRFGAASAFFLVFFRKKIFPLPPGAVTKSLLLGTILVLGFIAQNVGLQYTTASKSAFITSLMVVLVPLIQFVFERRSPTIGNILGIAVVVGGLWLLTSPMGSSFNTGDWLTLICAVLYAFYIVYLDIASKSMSPMQLTFLQSAVCAVLSTLVSIGLERTYCVPTASMILSVGYLTLFATVLTTFVQTRFQKETTPTRAAVIFSIEPVWATTFAYLLIGETLGAFGIIGGALIVTGVLVSELSDKIPGLNRGILANGDQ